MGTYYIDTDVSGGDSSGDSWTNALASMSVYEALNRNLVSLDESDTVNCRGSTNVDASGTIYWSGWTTDATRTITIIGDNTSSEWNNTAYRMVEASTTTVYNQSGHHVTFRNIQFDGGSAADAIDLHAANWTFENCIIKSTGLQGVYCHAGADCVFTNCIFIGSTNGIWIQGATGTFTVDNCLFDNATNWLWDNSAATVNLNNCVLIEESRSGSTATVNYTYCASETGVGTNAQTLSATQTDDFVDAANNDYTPVGTGVLVGNGNSCPTNDITGEARTGACDIGPINYDSGGSSIIPQASNYYRMMQG